MENKLNKIILDSQAKFMGGVRKILKGFEENQEELNVKLENQGRLLNEMNKAIRKLGP